MLEIESWVLSGIASAVALSFFLSRCWFIIYYSGRVCNGCGTYGHYFLLALSVR